MISCFEGMLLNDELSTKTSDIIYKVNREKGIVVAILTGCSDIAIRRINKYAKKLSYVPYNDRYEIKENYVGVAKCNEKDTFDEEKGKQIALTKAKKKRGKAINSALDRFKKDIEKELKTITLYGYTHFDE